jgi:hypothetical protein
MKMNLTERQKIPSMMKVETVRKSLTNARQGRETVIFGKAVFHILSLWAQRGQMEVEYQIGNRFNDSDKLTFNVENGDFENGTLSLDTALSNTFQSKYLTQELEFGYQFLSEKIQGPNRIGVPGCTT